MLDVKSYPFEVWINGAEQPRGLGAIAKTLSMDMRTDDRAWLEMKLSALEKSSGDDGFEMAMPPDGNKVRVPSLVSGFAKLVRYRCNELGAFADHRHGTTPVVDALMGPKEPKTGPDGTLSWTVDVINHATGERREFESAGKSGDETQQQHNSQPYPWQNWSTRAETSAWWRIVQPNRSHSRCSL